MAQIKPVDLLAFGAHPDDAEISCGGLLAKAAAQGYGTAIVDLTRGEMGTRGDVATRQKEAEAAAKILKLTARYNLALPDCAIDRLGTPNDLDADDSQLAKVVACLRTLRPEVVLVQYPKCRHPDHIAAGELITKAIYFAGLAKYMVKGLSSAENERFSPRQVIYYQTRVEFQPSFGVDTSAYFDLKLEAIKAHASQLGLDQSAAPSTLLSSPQTLSAIEARDRKNGALIGAQYGELFLTANLLALADPLKHFRENPSWRRAFGPKAR